MLYYVLKKIFTKEYLLIFTTSVSLILFLDFLIGIKLINFFFKEQSYPEYVKDKKLHHKLVPNFRGEVLWRNKSHLLCTDVIGSKIDCVKNYFLHDYDYALIGDSFIEGIGLSAKDNISGHLEKINKDKSFINLGVRSYSNIIYLEKVKYLINNNLISFRELILFPDLSDIQDDSFYYTYDKNSQSIIDQVPVGIKRKTKNKLRSTFPFLYHTIWLTKESFVKKCTYLEKCFVRGGWAYNQNIPINNFLRKPSSNEIEKSIEISLSYAEELYKFLKSKNIKLSVVVYPWPGSLLHDNANSKHVLIWKKFCIDKCENFINTYMDFFKLTEQKGKTSIINDFYMFNDVHFNGNGSKFIAEVITKKLISNDNL